MSLRSIPADHSVFWFPLCRRYSDDQPPIASWQRKGRHAQFAHSAARSGARRKFNHSHHVSVEKPDAGDTSRSRPREPIAAPKPLVTGPVDNHLPLPDDGSLPPCPTWDWSKGPPPMQTPFDRSKLYCPPPPFAPSSQPAGCRCEK